MTPITGPEIDATAAEVSALIADRIGPRGPDLGRQLRRAGRRLPRRVRRAVRHIVEAQGLSGNPRLLRMVDGAAMAAARDAAVGYLETVDPRARRRTALLRWTALVALNLLVIAGIVIWVLVARGIV
jgi:hypothetical protein